MDEQFQAPVPYQQPPVQTHSFGERVMGALKLERPIFDEVRRDTGAMTQAALGVLAADTVFNTTKIDLTGLASTGIEYLPQG